MSTILEDVKPETAAIIAAQAKAKGLSLDEYIRSLLVISEIGLNKPLYETASPDELANAIVEWANSHDPKAPVVLNDSREAIYDDDAR